jgi:hypothetical protein
MTQRTGILILTAAAVGLVLIRASGSEVAQVAALFAIGYAVGHMGYGARHRQMAHIIGLMGGVGQTLLLGADDLLRSMVGVLVCLAIATVAHEIRIRRPRQKRRFA